MKFGGRSAPLSLDPELIRSLALLLSETGLSEIEYSVGDHRVRVARFATEPARNTGLSGGQRDVVASEPTVDLPAHAGVVTSPMVGIAYLSPQPGAAPFVRLGEMVAEGQPLLIIEAMKVMNEIRASRSGRITQILIGDAHPVEYGEALMVLE